MDTLSDMSKPLDIAFLDNMVQRFYEGDMKVQQTLVEFQDHPDSWMRADCILDKAQNPQTKMIALIILQKVIKQRWKILPTNQKEGIKTFIVNLIIKISSDAANLQNPQSGVLLRKLNMVLICIVKQDWPHNWPTFISDLVNSSKNSESLCANNMQILLLLSEEVFEYSSGEMTQEKMKIMKKSLNKEFTLIFQLCDYILENSSDHTLLMVTLRTLLRFLHWIPVGYIFETKLIETLAVRFFPAAQFQNATLQCLTEIGSLNLKDRPAYNPQFIQLFVSVITQVDSLLTADTDISKVYAQGSESATEFVCHLTLFVCGFLKAHLELMENGDQNTQRYLGISLNILLRLSQVDEREIFKICLEYWIHLVTQLYDTMKFTMPRTPLLVGLKQETSPRLRMYAEILSNLRRVMISKMAKPEEVLIVEDENGQIVRESMKDTDSIVLYKNMRECLIYLTHLDPADAQETMLHKLSKQVDDSEWSWHNLNTLCWAIGSISGALTEMQEKSFLVRVIKDLLGLCEMKRGKDHKAVIASNIMYVVGQYPRFLRQHWKFLKTVVNKLFEFMHEKHPGVQDMACETFLKIAQKCKRKFVTLQQGEAQPFIVELTELVPSIILELENHQVHTFYEAAACMLSERALAVGQAEPLDRQKCLMELLALPNQSWAATMAQAGASGGASLQTPEACRDLSRFLKTNTRVCGAVGPLYVAELQVLYGDLMNVYTAYSEYQKLMVDQGGEMATHNSLFKAMRGVKRETLRLLTAFVERCAEPEAPPAAVAASLLPLLLQPSPASVLGDYHRAVPAARDADVLLLFSTCIAKLPLAEYEGGAAVPRILEALFECTLQMIVGNFEDFPDIRLQFFQLLKAVNAHCFPALFAIPQAHRKLVVDSVAYAMKHTERNVAETGLDILFELLQNVDRHPHVAQEFYQQFLLLLLQEVLYVMTDRLHKSGIKMHATLLRHMLHLVEMGKVTVPLFDPATRPPGTTNPAFLRDYIGTLLVSQFPNLAQHQVVAFVQGLFDLSVDVATFKQHLRDFLVQLKEFAGDGEEGNAGLYEEEAAHERAGMAAADQARRAAVPGILNPYEVPDDMADTL